MSATKVSYNENSSLALLIIGIILFVGSFALLVTLKYEADDLYYVRRTAHVKVLHEMNKLVKKEIEITSSMCEVDQHLWLGGSNYSPDQIASRINRYDFDQVFLDIKYVLTRCMTVSWTARQSNGGRVTIDSIDEGNARYQQVVDFHVENLLAAYDQALRRIKQETSKDVIRTIPDHLPVILGPSDKIAVAEP